MLCPPQALCAALPRTASFMKTSAQALPALEQSLAAASVPSAPAASTSGSSSPSASSQALPVNMRTGVAQRSPSASSSSSAPAAARPTFPVQLASWKGTFRAALAAAVAGDQAAAGEQLPEVLQYDRERLHAAQNAFQELLVLAAGLLIVQQLRQQQGLGWTAAEREAARRRLLVVLADPGMKPSDLVTEISQLSSGKGGSDGMALEAQVQQVFSSIVSPGSGPYRSIRSALVVALLAHLLHGSAQVATDGALQRAVMGALGKVGASALVPEVAALADQLARIAAVNEAVHDAVLINMCL
jgi:hypothetical protein